VLSCSPAEAAVLLKAMITGLHMQVQADPDAVDRDAAVAALGILVGARAKTETDKSINR
jgi:hypothetical protein